MPSPEPIGLLVVSRARWLMAERLSPSPRVKELASREPARSALAKYRGFEGVSWPKCAESWPPRDENDLARLEYLDAVVEYASSLPTDLESEVLLLTRPCSYGAAEPPAPGFRMKGFELGCWNSQTDHFSILLHEVLLGRSAELREFTHRLNSSALLPDTLIAEELLATRRTLAAAGADLEEFEPADEVGPIAVFALH